MKRTLDQFAAECKDILTAEPGPEGREKVAQLLSEVLSDQEFVEANVGPGTSDRQLLYEDPDLGFAILAHSYSDARTSSPHDHGPTWAIYGQASGVTEMTEWDVVEPASQEKTGLAKVNHIYNLEPGQAKVYNEGVLHSPRRETPTRLIRIEGLNMDKQKRFAYKPV
jgi:predicted metal-dependent enzyme (double-stranded beta helix superfamily)